MSTSPATWPRSALITTGTGPGQLTLHAHLTARQQSTHLYLDLYLDWDRRDMPPPEPGASRLTARAVQFTPWDVLAGRPEVLLRANPFPRPWRPAPHLSPEAQTASAALRRLAHQERRRSGFPTWQLLGDAELLIGAGTAAATFDGRVRQARRPLAALAADLSGMSEMPRQHLLRGAAAIWILHGHFDPPDLRAPLRWASRPEL